MRAAMRRCRCASSGRARNRVTVIDSATGEAVAKLQKLHPDGFFAGAIEQRRQPFAYRLRLTRGDATWEAEDAYRFPPVLGALDVYLMAEGSHRRIFERLGAHPCSIEGVSGASFAVWAPNAQRVSVVGDFNDWDGRRHPMRKRVEAGTWEIFIPGVEKGDALQIRAARRERQAASAEDRPDRFRAGACRPRRRRAWSDCRGTTGRMPNGCGTATAGRR